MINICKTCGKEFKAHRGDSAYCPGPLRKAAKAEYLRNRIVNTTAENNELPRLHRDKAHHASDIMHAPPDKAFRMIDGILSGRDLFVGVG